MLQNITHFYISFYTIKVSRQNYCCIKRSPAITIVRSIKLRVRLSLSISEFMLINFN